MRLVLGFGVLGFFGARAPRVSELSRVCNDFDFVFGVLDGFRSCIESRFFPGPKP